MHKVIKCGLIGGFVLFLWGFVSWSILPWQKSDFKSFANEGTMKMCIQANASESGIYQLPSCNTENHEQRMSAKKQMEDGPFVFAFVSMDGKSSNKVAHEIATLILKIAAVGIAVSLLFQTRLNFKHSVVFFLMIGLLIGLMQTLPFVIWVGSPLLFALAMIFKSVVGWLLAGFAVAKVAKR